MPNQGWYYSDSTDGTLPETVDLDMIEYTRDYTPVAITFYRVDEKSPSVMRQSMGKGRAHVSGKK